MFPKPIILAKLIQNVYHGQSSPQFLATFVVFKKNATSKQSQHTMEKVAQKFGKLL
jgi:hypothetical protein